MWGVAESLVHLDRGAEAVPVTDQARKRRGHPGLDSVRQELHLDRQTPPRDPVGPQVPDEDAAETFVGGAGISWSVAAGV
jgi:hypothetical protein